MKVSARATQIILCNIVCFSVVLTDRRFSSKKTPTLLLDKILINRTALSVSGFKYNENVHHSEWVERVLGPTSVFYLQDGKKAREPWFPAARVDRRKPMLNTTKIEGTNTSVVDLLVPGDQLLASCSIEILAYAKLSSQHCPFCWEYYGNIPSIGTGSIRMYHGLHWQCYYRAQYENWRYLPTRVKYWSVFVYCPAPVTFDSETCAVFEKRAWVSSPATMHLSLNVADPNQSPYRVSFKVRRENHDDFPQRNVGKTAICLPLTYSDANTALVKAQGALLRLFIKYYSNLGMKIIIYDGVGEAAAHISAPHVLGEQTDILYHDFTLLRLLEPTYAKVHKPEAWHSSFLDTDSDKVLTVTHCRFHAQSVLGIRHVLVIDYDEFLYCPHAPPGLDGLRGLWNEQLARWREVGFEQVQFQQRFIANNTGNTKECMLKAADDGEDGLSMFKCFHEFAHHTKHHSLKSLHITNHCPFTTYHEACSEDGQQVSCACNSLFDRQCDLVHMQMAHPGFYKNHAFGVSKHHLELYEMIQNVTAVKSSLAEKGIEEAQPSTKVDPAIENRHQQHEEQQQQQQQRDGLVRVEQQSVSLWESAVEGAEALMGVTSVGKKRKKDHGNQKAPHFAVASFPSSSSPGGAASGSAAGKGIGARAPLSKGVGAKGAGKEESKVGKKGGGRVSRDKRSEARPSLSRSRSPAGASLQQVSAKDNVRIVRIAS